jgi:hypothetical protein
MLYVWFGLLEIDFAHNVNFWVGGYKLKVKLKANVKIIMFKRWKALAKGGGFYNFKQVCKDDL